jgi:hypothetical protein
VSRDRSAVSPFRQPKGVWAVAFACVVSFMGIGLVDPMPMGSNDGANTDLRGIQSEHFLW